MAKKEVIEEPAEEVERYYVIESIEINNNGAGTINVNIIQQGQPTNPGGNPPPPKP